MEPGVDLRQTRKETVGSLEPTHRWVPGQAADHDAVVEPRIPEFSYLAECECPDDCPRDHENE